MGVYYSSRKVVHQLGILFLSLIIFVSSSSCIGQQQDCDDAPPSPKAFERTTAGSVLLQQKTLSMKAVVDDVEVAPTLEVAHAPLAADKSSTAMKKSTAPAPLGSSSTAAVAGAALTFMQVNNALQVHTTGMAAMTIACMLAFAIIIAYRRGNREKAIEKSETETAKIIECAMALEGHTTDPNPMKKSTKDKHNLLNWAMNFDPDTAKNAGFGDSDSSSSDAGAHSESEPDPETDSENSNK